MRKRTYCFTRTFRGFVRAGYPRFYSFFTCSCARFLNTPRDRANMRAVLHSIISAERVLNRSL